MSTLLVVQSYAGANSAMSWLWPYYEKSGCDILGVGRTNAKCIWPGECCEVDIGEDPKKLWVDHRSPNLSYRMVNTFRHCITSPELEMYDDFCVVEWDSIFLKPVPEYTGGLLSHLAGGPMGGFKASKFFHCPWWADRETASKIVATGDQLLSEGEYEMGSPDVFMGLIVDRSGIPWTNTHTFSVNTIDNPTYVQWARKAVADGVWHIHGIKTTKQLAQVLK